jgi:hypothetical protein
MTDENFDTESITPEASADEAQPDAAEPHPTTSEEAIGSAPNPTVGAAPESEAQQEEAAEVKPREVIKGIHPELLCQDPICGPEFTELQFFSPEEATKTKGKAMLFCARSGKKYFAPAAELQTWIAENKVAKTGRGRKDG